MKKYPYVNKSLCILSLLMAVSVFISGCSVDWTNLSSGQEESDINPESSYTVSVNYPEEETSPEKESENDQEEIGEEEMDNTENYGIDPELDAAMQKRLSVQLITPNEYSRPGDALTEVNNIVVHYLGNPGTTGQENRDYFDSLAYTGEEYASPHFIIGLEGEIIQLIPLDEISYCSNDRNYDTVAIECCHPDESGVFTDETYDSLVLLTAWLCERFDLDYTDVIRHYDVTGKICPRAFVENPDYYYSFKTDVANTLGYDISIEEVEAACEDEFLDPEEVERYFAKEDFEENWRPGPGGPWEDRGPDGGPGSWPPQ